MWKDKCRNIVCGKINAKGSLFDAPKSCEKFMKIHNEYPWLLDADAHVQNERMWVLKGYDYEKAWISRMKRCIWWKGVTVMKKCVCWRDKLVESAFWWIGIMNRVEMMWS